MIPILNALANIILYLGLILVPLFIIIGAIRDSSKKRFHDSKQALLAGVAVICVYALLKALLMVI